MLFLFLAFCNEQKKLVRPKIFGHKNVSLSCLVKNLNLRLQCVVFRKEIFNSMCRSLILVLYRLTSQLQPLFFESIAV